MNNNTKILVALDLDGTSVRYEPRLEMDPAVIEFIKSVRPDGVRWVMNSDRYTDTMVEIAEQLEPEERPVAILSCQRFIHTNSSGNRFMPCSEWNDEQLLIHKKLWDNISRYFGEWRRAVERDFTIINSAVNEQVFAYMVPSEETPALRQRMLEFISPWPDARVSGNQEWTFILHSSFSKARVLKKCAGLLGVDSLNIIAIGDGINDVSMLDGSAASMVGCPSNACCEVTDTVASAGGLIADSEAAAGTVQILNHYLKLKINTNKK